MTRRWSAMFARMVVFAIIAFTVFGFAVRGLWNWLMPALFGLHAITYWQGIGLLALSWLLFGGLRGMGGRRYGRYGRHRMMERWQRMTPEEREKFRENMRNWCGAKGPGSETKV